MRSTARVLRLSACLVAAGCGRLHYEAQPEEAGLPDGALDGGAGDAGSTEGGLPDAGLPDAGEDTAPCGESPCRLVTPQCGCTTGEMCTWPRMTGARLCAATGAVEAGSTCEMDYDCGAGTGCVHAGPIPTGQCNAWCASEADCAMGEVCMAFDTTAPIGTCSRICDPVTGGGCPDPLRCALALAYRITTREVVSVALCTANGPRALGEPCTGVWDCATGLACAGPTCERFCNVATPTCDVGMCQRFSEPGVVDGVEYGYCN